MSYNFGKTWLEALEDQFGEVNEFQEIQCDGKPKIYLLYFYDLPEKGIMTAVTSGLSNANHPDWKYGKPELIISLETDDLDWGFGIGYFASAFFEEKTFSFGDVFQTDDPISKESGMNAFLTFAPSFLDQDQATFSLPDRTIHLTGMYPIYEEEIELYDKIGLEKFWFSDGFEIYNPQRDKIKS